MKKEVFRKKSLDKMRSPENLNEYIKVASPSVWLVLVGVLVLLLGTFLWASIGNVNSIIETEILVENGQGICHVPVKDCPELSESMPVYIGDTQGSITGISQEAHDADVYDVYVSIAKPDGAYAAGIVTQSYAPISFIFN